MRRQAEQRRQEKLPRALREVGKIQSPFAPWQVLTDAQVNAIDSTALRILEEVGLLMMDDNARATLKAAGATVDEDEKRVFIGRDIVKAQLALVPSQFDLEARNPANTLTIGQTHINFATAGGASYYSDLETERRPATLDDYERLIKLAQLSGPVHMIDATLLNPPKFPALERNVRQFASLMRYTDKALLCAIGSAALANNALDQIALAFGGRAAIQDRPVILGNFNINSALRYDQGSLQGLRTFATAGQPIIVSAYILAGAVSPVTIAGILAQQHAEILAGIALTQLINPSTPVVYGHFATNIELKSGVPAYGTPEGALLTAGAAQLARHYSLPFRSSSGLNTAKSVDAQSAYESQMNLWPAVQAHSNVVMHGAGVLESGLVCSLEKFMIDVEHLGMMRTMQTGIEVNEDTLAFDTIASVPSNGHFLNTDHTMARYKTAFYEPIVSDRLGYGPWEAGGKFSTAQKANLVATQALAAYEAPKIEASVLEQVEAHVAKTLEAIAR